MRDFTEQMIKSNHPEFEGILLLNNYVCFLSYYL